MIRVEKWIIEIGKADRNIDKLIVCLKTISGLKWWREELKIWFFSYFLLQSDMMHKKVEETIIPTTYSFSDRVQGGGWRIMHPEYMKHEFIVCPTRWISFYLNKKMHLLKKLSFLFLFSPCSFPAITLQLHK